MEPAASPLRLAICIGSPADTIRVRLLSIAQARQAPATSSADPSSTILAAGFHARIIAPIAIDIMPIAIRVLTCSRNNDQARSAVKTPSRLSRSEDWTAVPAARPYVSSTGPMTPPKTMAPASQRRSSRLSGASGTERPRKRCPTRQRPRPAPEPR